MYINVMRLLVNNLRGEPMAKDVFEYDSEEKVNNSENSCSCINSSCNMKDLLYKTCSWTHQG